MGAILFYVLAVLAVLAVLVVVVFLGYFFTRHW